MKRLLLFLALVLMLPGATAAQSALPAFKIWVECVQRGPYPGQAVAKLSYRYDGEFRVVAEDARQFGDTSSGQTQVFAFSPEPGEHIKFTDIPVGANKVIVWKIILFEQLHVVTVYDDPTIADCDWIIETPTPTAAPSL